jgi:flavin prenyltransferase
VNLQRSQHAVRVVLGVTGASGSIYAEFVLRILLKMGIRTYLIFTDTAQKVIQTELSSGLLPWLAKCEQRNGFENDSEFLKIAEALELNKQDLSQLKRFDNADFYAPVASGSEGATHMIICPCSMGSMARVAHGMSTCLLERAADVMLKERRPLVIVPRESPLSLVHVQNMSLLLQAGASLVPAMPGFYTRPKTIDDIANFMAERIIENLRIPDWQEHRKEVSWNFRQL